MNNPLALYDESKMPGMTQAEHLMDLARMISRLKGEPYKIDPSNWIKMRNGTKKTPAEILYVVNLCNANAVIYRVAQIKDPDERAETLATLTSPPIMKGWNTGAL